MLFGYPVSATEENWLHNCLCEILHSIHASVKTATTLPAWPEIVPEPYRPRLHRRTGIRLSLENSQPFAGTLTTTGQVPKWQIEFAPASEELFTWDKVFRIRERYEKDVLDPAFKSWLDDFKLWCKSAKIAPSSDQELVDGLNSYATLYEEMGISDRAFLKAAVFRMLHTHCQQGDQRLISLIMSIVNPGQTNLLQTP